MAPKSRSKSEVLYGGGPKELPESDLPTYRDVARYVYFVSASEFEVKRQLEIVAAKLVEIWQKCNPLLPLLKEFSIYVKLKRFVDQVKAVNRKQKRSKQALGFVESRKDHLFDISACSCKLPILPCDDRLVQCKAAPGDCVTQHIVCECPQDRKVPAAEREYLRDQRSKIGTTSKFQIGPVDRAAAAKQAAREARQASVPPVRCQRLQETIFNPELSFEVSFLMLIPTVLRSSVAEPQEPEPQQIIPLSRCRISMMQLRNTTA
jgi:hypothetical protein